MVVEKLQALIDYVASDYDKSVSQGRIVSQSEYDEQAALLEQATALTDKLVGSVESRSEVKKMVADFSESFHSRRSGQELRKISRKLVTALREHHGLVFLPMAPPSRSAAERTFTTLCASCHGADGRADTEKARSFQPPVASFHEAERMLRMSPQVAYGAISYGVPGTSMASFAQLSSQERWNLAFWVLAMRYPDGSRERCDQLKGQLSAQPGTTLSMTALAALDDEDLIHKAQAVAAPNRGELVACLRRDFPFRPAAEGLFSLARERLSSLGQLSATDQTLQQNRAAARTLSLDAYLAGFEPSEPLVRYRSPKLGKDIEEWFSRLREAAEGGKSAEVNQLIARITIGFDALEEREQASRRVPFWSAFLIAVREGFEVSLLLAALVAVVRKRNRPREEAVLHSGWLAAVGSGALLWFILGALLSGSGREATEGILTLSAAVLLLLVSHVVLGRVESQKWLTFLRTQTSGTPADDGMRRYVSLFGVAFLAVFRESVEVVLFYKALLLDTPHQGTRIALGAASGIVVLMGVVWAFARWGRKLNPRPLMRISGVLLSILAVSFVGQAFRSFQLCGWLSVTRIFSFVSLPTLGIFPTAETLLAQLVALLFIIYPYLLARWSNTGSGHNLSNVRQQTSGSN